MSDLEINDRVIVIGKNVSGTIAFKGKTEFSKGLWFGIILDEPKGRNNGSYGGVRYFKCAQNYGIFMRVNQIKKLSERTGIDENKHRTRNYKLNRESKTTCTKSLQKKSARNDNYYDSDCSSNNDGVVDNSSESEKSELSLDYDAENSAKCMPFAKRDMESNDDITSNQMAPRVDVNQTGDENEIGEGKETSYSNETPSSADAEDFTMLLNKAIEERRISDIKELIKREEVKLVETEEYIKNFKKKFSLE